MWSTCTSTPRRRSGTCAETRRPTARALGRHRNMITHWRNFYHKELTYQLCGHMTVWNHSLPVAMADGGNVLLPSVCWHDRWRRFPRVTGRETEAWLVVGISNTITTWVKFYHQRIVTYKLLVIYNHVDFFLMPCPLAGGTRRRRLRRAPLCRVRVPGVRGRAVQVEHIRLTLG